MNIDEAIELTLRRARGFDGFEAEAVAVEGDRLDVGVRLGKTEKLKRSRERRLALRLFAGQSSAVTSTADLRESSLAALVADCAGLARATTPDPFSGLPDLQGEPPLPRDLDLFDPPAEGFTAEHAIAIARDAEEAALAFDPRLTNSEGAEFSVGSRRLVYATSRGFQGEQRSSSFSLTVVPVAATDTSMQRDYWYSAARHRAHLDDPRDVGRRAAERALRRLGARPVATCALPVVFDSETAASLLGHLASAVSGSAVYRGMSFLRDRLGAVIGPETLRIVDDPLRPAGLASRRFDAEGLTSRRNVVVDGGVLRTFLLDTYSARKLGRRSTASAVRSLGEAPMAGATNLYLEPGSLRPEEVIGSVANGFYVTELIGSGVNAVTGDYSRGAAGLWIENGRLAFPVEEVTIAGNLHEMFAGIEAIGNDLVFRSSVSAPTLKVAKMTVAGRG
ncbi:MAG TPA: metallopeptidase TldD-related protein [Candidatus Binatia bacterium]|nr:metallopeptidase TldD-related protein [Candidatus Binatia bacterium]